MNKTYAILLSIAFSLLATNIFAESDSNTAAQEAPKGMEIINVGTDGQQLILPKGTKMRKVGAQLIIEDNAKYIAERIWKLENRIKELELADEELKKEILKLKGQAD